MDGIHGATARLHNIRARSRRPQGCCAQRRDARRRNRCSPRSSGSRHPRFRRHHLGVIPFEFLVFVQAFPLVGTDASQHLVGVGAGEAIWASLLALLLISPTVRRRLDMPVIAVLAGIGAVMAAAAVTLPGAIGW